MAERNRETRKPEAEPIRVLLGVMVVFALHATALAQTRDVVEVRNGDRFTGDVSSLQRGTLAFGTDSAGTIEITWSDVVRLTSIQRLDVEVRSGTRYTGTVRSPAAGQLIVETAAGPSPSIALADLVRIRVVGETFLQRSTGSVDFGLTWTSGSATYAFDGTGTNRTRSFETTLKIESWLSWQDEGDTRTRNMFELEVRRLLPKRWYYAGIARFQQDDDLDLDGRLFLGGGIGRWLLDTSKAYVSVEGGLDYNGERFSGLDVSHSPEAFGGIEWHWSPDSPTDVSLEARTEVGLNRSRVRLGYEAAVRRDIFWDLYWSVRAVEDFDSDPPVDLPNSSFAVAVGVGWSF